MHHRASRAAVLGCAIAGLAAFTPSAIASKPKVGQFMLPQGDTFTLSNGTLAGCDPLTYGYQVQNQTAMAVGNNAGSECENAPTPDVTVGPYPRDRLVELYLTDSVGPTYTFYSPNKRHTTVSGSGPYQIYMCDAFTGMSPPSQPCGQGQTPQQAQNLSVTLTINAPTTADALRAPGR